MSIVTTKDGAEIYYTDTGEHFDIQTLVMLGEDHHKFRQNSVKKSGRLIKGEKQNYCAARRTPQRDAPRQGQRDVLAFIKS